jgi:hypothetical protein
LGVFLEKMINNLSIVNQKLAFAKATERLLSKEVVAQMQAIQVQSLTQSFLSHLGLAFHFYVRELAERYQLKNTHTINSVDELIKSLASVGKVASEAEELHALLRAQESWLAQLQLYYQALFISPEKPIEKKAFPVAEPTDNLINLIEVNEICQVDPLEQLKQLTPELLSAWLNQFQLLIDRQRDTSAEY